MKAARFVPLLAAALPFCAVPAHATWIQTQGPDAGPASVLSVDPTSGHVFAIASKSAFRSTDGGATWQPLFGGLRGDLNAAGIAARGGTAYIGGTGALSQPVFRSTDNGATWVQAGGTGLPILGFLQCIWIQGSTLVAGAGGSGIYRSTDAGDSWTAATGIPANTSIGFIVENGTDLYAATTVASITKGVYRSTDGGLTWASTNFTAGTPSGLARNANGVFVSTNLAGIHRTTNSGANWVKVNTDIPTNFAAAILATSSHVFAGVSNGAIYRADANGNNWTAVTTGLPPQNAGLAVYALAASGSSVLAGMGNLGVWRTTDNGANWARSNTGWIASRIDGMLADGADLFASADGAAYFRTSNHGDAWSTIVNGVDPYVGWYGFARTGSTLLGGAGSGKLYRSDDRGDLWTLSNAGLSLTGTFVFAVDRATPSDVFAGGYYGVEKSTDSGQSWTSLNTGFTFTQTVSSLWQNGLNLIAGANAGVKRSTDGGATWTAPMAGLPPGGGYPAIAENGGVLLMASTQANLLRSTDLGASWTASAVGITGSTHSLLAKGADFYAGTSAGVYNSTDGGLTWTAVNEGLPAGMWVSQLAANDTYVFAGTFQNGVWRRPLSEMGSTPVQASLVSARAEAGRVHVRWYLGGDREVTVQRRVAQAEWADLGVRASDGGGYVTYEDEDVVPGARYGYRVTWTGAGGQVVAGEVWMDVPASTGLALLGARPNPAHRGFAVAFTLPRAGRVRIDVTDAAGRRIGEVLDAELASGAHALPAPVGDLGDGLYFVRLRFEGETRTARVVHVRP